jgi:hypothetical protein
MTVRKKLSDLPVEEFFGWLPLGALALMALNDHFLRLRYPGVVTGKISDFCVLLFFPALLTASCDLLLFIADVVARAVSRGRVSVPYRLTKLKVILSAVLSGLILAMINISVPARDLLLGVASRLDVFHLFRAFRVTMDATDLVALVVLPLSVWWGYRVVDRQSARTA